ncbi:response regulator [Paenibacillus sp. WLX1005]|uniref:response regulator n=1 Tax=Paenibacillus sp. WLX1005 TaxID=3243766 RepID=UPI00398413EA
MRGQLIVVWLEDNQNGRDHKSRVKLVKQLIENKGYSVLIEEVEDLQRAKSIISDREKRIDFFISDYNLGDGDTGLEYLMEIRKNQMYKQFFVLYSKNEYNERFAGE